MILNITFVLPSFAGGGAERVILHFAANLDRSRFAASLIVMDGQGPLADDVPGDIPIVDLARPRLRTALPKLIGALRRQQPWMIVSTLGYVNLALLACRPLLPRGVRLILREANIPSLYLPNVPFGRLMRVGYKRLYRRADKVVCTSRRMADDFQKNFGVPGERIAVVPNPVDVASLRRAAARPRRLPGPGRRFVAAGWKTHQKGLDRLLYMVSQMSADTGLLILGVGAARNDLVNRAQELGIVERVTLVDFEPEPWEHYAGADAFVLPSRWEGMANAALEALACGTPVIATPDAGGIAEVAAQAPAGAVTIAAAGESFLAAMRGVGARPEVRLRKSLLPDAFCLTPAVAAFEDFLSSQAV